jgi:FAD/FMN-containing dehydrogenase
MLAEEVVSTFKTGLRGTLLRPGDEGYDAARKVWNGMIDKKPSFIVQCRGVADVVSAVNFARTNHFPVAIRAGGHNVAGNAVCDAGLVIDLSLMKGIRVDPSRRTARAEGGAIWGELDHETQTFGLATTGGIVSTTGIAGLTLGGGMGFLMRKYGLACDNLLSVDIVSAKGEVLTASATENTDLFWGVRGGGGNFGVVTSLEYKLHPVDKVLGGLLVHPFEKAKDALKFYREFNTTTPDELTCYAVVGTSPDGKPVVVIAICYNGPIEDGERALQPLRKFGPPLADQVAPMTYEKFQQILTPLYPPGNYHYWKSNFLKGLDDEAIDTILMHFAARPNLMCHVAFEQVGGAVKRVGPEDTAFNHRNAPYNLLIFGVWSDPAESDKCIRWAREFWNAIQPFSSGGVYVNYLGREADEGAERVKAAYGPQKYQRLVELKNKFDPNNLFRFNQNIKPTG